MKTNNSQSETQRNFSRIDSSGTDPNRYASLSNPEQAEKYKDMLTNESKNSDSLIPGLSINVGTIERILMVAAGSYLLYKALSTKEKNIKQSIAGGTMLFRGVSGYCPVYDAMDRSGKFNAQNVNIRTSITVDKPVDEVYNFWRNLENLPRFMSHLKNVNEVDRITSEWTAKGPAGIGQVSWKAQILMDEPGEMLSWCSLPDSTVDNAGKVVFKKISDNQTEIDVTISYHAPLGVAGEAAAKLLNPVFETMVKKDIENFKSVLESDAPAMAY